MLNYLEDAEGRFARASGMFLTGSSGGVSFLTASGKRLGEKHLHGTTATGIKDALEAWNKLPETERAPGAIKIGDKGPTDSKRATVQPPAGCLILKIYGRYLTREPKDVLRTTTLLKDFPGVMEPAIRHPGHLDYNSEANPDFMWLTEAEWRSLVPSNSRKGDNAPFPASLVQRMWRYHLLPDALHGRTGDTWGPKGVRSQEVTLTVEDASDAVVHLTLDGFVWLGKAFDPAGPPRTLGYEASLRGRLTYDIAKKAFTQFDVVVLGDMYGEAAKDSWFYRPGRHPVGFAFELSSGATPVDRLPPRGNMTQSDLERYLGLGR